MNEDTIITLELNIAQINVLLTGLGKLPLESGIEVFQLVRKQVTDQVQQSQDSQPEIEE